jgi:hypothetical protein
VNVRPARSKDTEKSIPTTIPAIAPPDKAEELVNGWAVTVGEAEMNVLVDVNPVCLVVELVKTVVPGIELVVVLVTVVWAAAAEDCPLAADGGLGKNAFTVWIPVKAVERKVNISTRTANLDDCQYLAQVSKWLRTHTKVYQARESLLSLYNSFQKLSGRILRTCCSNSLIRGHR